MQELIDLHQLTLVRYFSRAIKVVLRCLGALLLRPARLTMARRLSQKDELRTMSLENFTELMHGLDSGLADIGPIGERGFAAADQDCGMVDGAVLPAGRTVPVDPSDELVTSVLLLWVKCRHDDIVIDTDTSWAKEDLSATFVLVDDELPSHTTMRDDMKPIGGIEATHTFRKVYSSIDVR